MRKEKGETERERMMSLFKIGLEIWPYTTSPTKPSLLCRPPMESRNLKLTEAMDPSITLRRSTRSTRRRRRRERRDRGRKDLLCSSSSTPPWIRVTSTYFFFFFFFFFFHSLYPTLTLAQETESDLFTLYNTTCGGDPVQDASAFTSNKANVLQTLQTDSSSNRYSFYKTNYLNEDLQGFYQCRGDLTLDLCNQCVSLITNGTQPNTCGSTTSFRMDTGVYSYRFYMNYSDKHNIRLASLLSFQAYAGGCSVLYMSASDNITSNSLTYQWSLAKNTSTVASSGFGPARDALLTNLSSVAPSQPDLFAQSNFTYASNASVYALMQCFGILNLTQCSQCLSLLTSSDVLNTMVNATEGLIYYGSCFGRFSSSPFYLAVNTTPAASDSVPPGSNPAPQESTSTSYVYAPAFHHINKIYCMCMPLYNPFYI